MGARVLLRLAAAALLAACGATVAASPTPAPSPLPVAELKYRVMDAGGRISFCDPDFYPVARADESAQAGAKIAEIRQDAATYAAITKRAGTEALAVYREWKALNALRLAAAAPIWTFSYRSTGSPSPSAGDPKAGGKQIEGSVDAYGKVDITRRSDAGPLVCPICLALGTRIATPAGDAAVEDLRIGDIVWTRDEVGVRVAAPIVAIGSAPVPVTHEVVRLVLADGRTVLASPGHPTADGRLVGELRAGDLLDGAEVMSADLVRYTAGFTFDLLPFGASGAYWANGVPLGPLTTRRQCHFLAGAAAAPPGLALAATGGFASPAAAVSVGAGSGGASGLTDRR